MNQTIVAPKTEASTTKAYVMKITLVAALGGLLFGYDTAVIAGAIGFLQIKFNLSPTMTGWVASSAIWGCVIGAMCAGYLSDKIGRKKVLILTAILFAISSVGAALPENLTQFILFRTIGGLGIGAASMLSPLYISEIAPARNRGTLVSIYQLAVVLGINLIYLVNLKIASLDSEAWNVAVGWRYMLGSGSIPAVLFLFLLLFVPESPRWLVKQGNTNAALVILKHLNSENRALEVLQEIKTTLSIETGTFRELFKPGLRMAMIVGGVLALFCQITGINAIIYFAPEIFKSVGFASDSALFQTLIIGIVNSIFTFVLLTKQAEKHCYYGG